jgi:hypothetical protein
MAREGRPCASTALYLNQHASPANPVTENGSGVSTTGDVGGVMVSPPIEAMYRNDEELNW